MLQSVAFLAELTARDNGAALEIVRSLFADDENCYVTAVNEYDIVLIRQVKADEEEKKLLKTAELIADTLQTELMENVALLR